MEYHLIPPFFIVSEESSFHEAWEYFCLKLLKFENNSNDIVKRKPPEKGVDLFYREKKRAYQCKSVLDGIDKKFNISIAKDSLKTAIEAKEEIGWKDYHLCTNVELTGQQIQSLKEIFSDIVVKDKSYWLHLCEKYPDEVKRNFRQLVSVSRKTPTQILNDSLENDYSNKQKQLLNKSAFPILFYYDKHNFVYEMKVSDEFTGEDLLQLILDKFKLPPTIKVDGTPYNEKYTAIINISYHLFLKDSEIDLQKTLTENRVTTNNIVTLYIKTEIDLNNINDIKFDSRKYEGTILATLTTLKKLFLKKAEIEIIRLLNGAPF
ncbi:hypothetical protein [Haliscomenobacter sp.]|uniref:hypothetical protein n=1 Tax=Haliscomenobacter sp. TaxID=2717303 RepID=UPI0035933D0E